MLRGTLCQAEKDVAAWPVARPAQKLVQNFGWALALANGSDDGRRSGWESRLRIDQRSEWLDFGC